MRRCLFLLLMLPLFAYAQTYYYLGVENGLSNRRVYYIQKDTLGYMWFLTHEGIDRYDGSEFKHYKLIDGDKEVNSQLNLNWLYLDNKGTLWEIGKKGKIFRYDDLHDRFVLEYKLPKTSLDNNPLQISYSCIDRHNNIWLCNKDAILLYNTENQQIVRIKNYLNEAITDMEQIDSTHFFIGTDIGIHYAQLKDNGLQLIYCDKLENVGFPVNELYFDTPTQKLFIGTLLHGIFVYDMRTKNCFQPKGSLTDISINRIKSFNDREILVATDGGGVYKINTGNYHTQPYIVADYHSPNAMNGNTIPDFYVDDEERIWLANYPIGITVRNNRYPSYNWIRHSMGTKQSLVNNRVNGILEDSEGDLWFATNNGISLYRTKTGKWHDFLSFFDPKPLTRNHIFSTLCEVKPGVIWAGGYSSSIYQIDKQTLKTEYFQPDHHSLQHIYPDKYICVMLRDSQGKVWCGGYYNLKSIDISQRDVRLYPGVSLVTAITEKDADHIWVGNATGLYLLNKHTGKLDPIKLPLETCYIYSLYQTADGSTLYIGTSSSGLFVYDLRTYQFAHYHTGNSELLSDNIYTILSDEDQFLMLGTENGISSFYPARRAFYNWTKDQGLMTTHFNAGAGILRMNGNFVLGSSDGAIEFHKKARIPSQYTSKMIFSDFRLFYQTVYPGEKGSPLQDDINRTEKLKLKYNENIFSLKVSSINYDFPSILLYSWKLEGFYDEWTRPEHENIIRFTNLNPGEYTLRVRAISNENRRVLEERQMTIVVAQPFWWSKWAMLLYFCVLAGVLTAIHLLLRMRKRRKESDEKIQFFVNTAHDIRTPLTLIKAPLEEMHRHEQFTPEGNVNIERAMNNVNALLNLTNNLINFERTSLSASQFHPTEQELKTFFDEVVDTFRSYASVKRIHLIYEINFRYLNVWFDKEKMESVVKNVISNALKYTPANGTVAVCVQANDETWTLEVKDTGIGIPAKEQKKLFKLYFRGSNAINSKIAGSGIGLMLVSKLVRLHKGKIHMTSEVNRGSVIKITFPNEPKGFHRLAPQEGNTQEETLQNSIHPSSPSSVYEHAKHTHLRRHPHILVVEDNDELRDYLSYTLSPHYRVETCTTGKEALEKIKDHEPELILSDIMMPEMRGDELTRKLKNDIETSHIPIILLTALSEEKEILKGLESGADRYITKPFSIGILKTAIANLLTNRELLRSKFANAEIPMEEEDKDTGLNELDLKFLAAAKQNVKDNMSEPDFNVDTLCGLMKMSRSSFYLKLKALTGQSPNEYIRLIRIKCATKLLKENKYNITEIADMTGFCNSNYFRKVFKEYFKMSPSEYCKKGGKKK